MSDVILLRNHGQKWGSGILADGGNSIEESRDIPYVSGQSRIRDEWGVCQPPQLGPLHRVWQAKGGGKRVVECNPRPTSGSFVRTKTGLS